MRSIPSRSLRRLALGLAAAGSAAVGLTAVGSGAASTAPWNVEASVPGNAYYIIPSPNGRDVYLGGGQSPTVNILSAQTNALTGSISLPAPASGANAMALDPQGRYLYVWDRPAWQTGSTVAKVDTTTNTAVGRVAVFGGDSVRFMAVDPGNTALYETSRNQSLNKTDLATNTLTSIPLTGPTFNTASFDFSPDGRYAYVATNNTTGSPDAGVVRVDLTNTSSQDYWVIDASRQRNLGSLKVSKDGKTLYLWDEDFADLYELDAATGAILKTIDAGAGCGTAYCGWGEPTALAISPTEKYAVGLSPGYRSPSPWTAPGAWMINLTTDAITPLGSAQGFNHDSNAGKWGEVVAFGPETTCSSKLYINYWLGADIARAIAGPCAPTGVTATPGVEKLDVSFTAPSDDGGSPITGYEYSIDGGTTWKSTGSTGTSFSITGLKAGTTYTVMVRGINAAAPGAVGTEAKGTPTAPEKKADEAGPTIALPAASVTRGATLTSVVNPSTAGTVKVTATLRGRTVCTATKKATRAGRMTVTCALGPAAQAAIRIKPVTLTVTARLTDAAGKTASAKRTVKVARYRVRTPVTG